MRVITWQGKAVCVSARGNGIPNRFNHLNVSGNYVYRLLYHYTTLHSAHTVHLCVPYGSHNKQSRMRRRIGNPVPGGITEPPCSWGI
jgi:hypothetical protein